MSDKTKILSYGKQWINEDDEKALVKALHHPSLTQGPKVEEFEEILAQSCGAKYAVAVNSGTSTLHIAILAAKISCGHEVITSPITFVASSNCALYTGAKPVFCDVDSETVLMNPAELEKQLSTKTRAVIPVHFAGQSAPMQEISEIVKRHSQKIGERIFIIEDAAHALGATYEESNVGSCEFSDMAILSFHPVKHITTAEGGAVLTNSFELYRRLKLFRSHGITRDLDMLENPNTMPWGYEQHELGYNYRISDLQCALGVSQMTRLDAWVQRRRKIADKYRQAFKNHPHIRLLKDHSYGNNSYHLFVVQMPFEKMGGRTKVMMDLREKGIITQVHYIPVHTQPYYKRNLGTKWGDFPKAEAYYENCLSIPMYPALTDEDLDRVIREINALF